MAKTDPIIIPIEGEPADFLKDAKAVNGALDKMQANVKQTGTASVSAAKTASVSWTDFRSAYMLVLDAVRIGQQIWAQTGAAFVSYAEDVKNLSRNIGASAEETSRLIQVADDVRISYGSLSVAMKMLQKEGIEVSTESLAKLSDQYLKLAPGVERTQFLLKNFGKSGLEMGKLMEQGGDSIRKMNDAIDESLVLSEDAIKKSDEYQKAVDNLNDSMEALKIEIGSELIPTVTKMIDGISNGTSIYKEFYREVIKGDKSFAEFNQEVIDSEYEFTLWGWQLKESAKAQEDLTETLDEGGEALLDNSEAVKAASDALDMYKKHIESVSNANKEQLDLTFQVADAQRDYEKSHADAVKNLQEAQAGGDSQAINEAIQGIQELEAEWHKSTQSMIYDMVQAQISVDGLTNAEYDALQDLAVQKGLITEQDAERAKAIRDEADAITNGILQQEDVQRENAAINQHILELEAAKTAATAGTTAEVMNTSAAMIQVVGNTQAAGQAMANLQAQAQAASVAASSIRIPTMGSVNVNKATAPSLMSVGGKSGGFRGVSSRDSGGVGEAGKPYMIGTGAQPEMFIPSTNGRFVPNADGAGKTIIVNITNPQPKAAEQSIRDQLKNLSYLGTIN